MRRHPLTVLEYWGIYELNMSSTIQQIYQKYAKMQNKFISRCLKYIVMERFLPFDCM